jgi:hypothetical protein
VARVYGRVNGATCLDHDIDREPGFGKTAHGSAGSVIHALNFNTGWNVLRGEWSMEPCASTQWRKILSQWQDRESDWLASGAGVLVRIRPHFQLLLDYEGDVYGGGYTAHFGKISLGWQFLLAFAPPSSYFPAAPQSSSSFELDLLFRQCLPNPSP